MSAKGDGARQQILQAAALMLRDAGYDAMSLRDLAGRVGMQAPSLYYHFPSKQALATAVLREGVDRVAATVRAALDARPGLAPRDRLLLAIRVHLDSLLAESAFTSAHIRCFPFLPDTVRAGLAGPRRDYDRLWDGLVGDYLGPDAAAHAVRSLRLALLGAMNSAPDWFDSRQDRIGDFTATLARMIPPSQP